MNAVLVGAPGEVFLLRGPARATLVEGRAEAVGAPLARRRSIRVPEGKSIPVEFLSAGALRWEAHAVPARLPGRTIPPAWDRLVARMRAERLRRILVLGEMDSGKTFFSTYVANRLVSARRLVGVLDVDLGQSDIGPPGTMGLALLRRSVLTLAGARADEIAFVGAHSPALHFLPSCAAFHALVRAGARADHLVVDTPGWVHGDGGRAWTRAQYDLLDPDIVVLLERGDELRHFASTLPTRRVVRLAVSKKATPTSPDVRKALREEISRAYMKGARRAVIEGFRTDRCYYGTGTIAAPPDGVPAGAVVHAERLPAWEGWFVVVRRPLPAEARAAFGARVVEFVDGDERGVLVGLLDEGERCLGLGSVERIDWARRRAVVWTPLGASAARRVRVVQIGSLRLTPEGNEAGFLPPGSL